MSNLSSGKTPETATIQWRTVDFYLPSGERVALTLTATLETGTEATLRDAVERLGKTALSESLRDVALNAVRAAYPEVKG